MSQFERLPRRQNPTRARWLLHQQFGRTFAAGDTLTMNTLWRTSPHGVIANVIGGVCETPNLGEVLVCAVTAGDAQLQKSQTRYLLYWKLGDGAMKLQSSISASRFETPTDGRFMGSDESSRYLLENMRVTPLATRQATQEYSALLRSSGEPANPSVAALIEEDPPLQAIESYGEALGRFAAGHIRPFLPGEYPIE